MISNIKVPHSGKLGADLLIVGEAPGETEEIERRPFVGYSGQKLKETLALYAISDEDVRYANLCNYRPEKNNFDHLVDHPLLNDGLNELDEYIKQYPPKCILALGERPLNYLADRTSIYHHRGSVLPYIRNKNIKIYHTYHPSYILRNPSKYFIFAFDVERAITQSKFPEFPYKKRNIHIVNSLSDAINYASIIQSKDRITIDIENTKKEKYIICVGFGVSEDESYVFPYRQYTIPIIHEICENPNITKCFHYGFCHDIEHFHLQGTTVKGKIEDTYILSHVLNPSLPKGLDFITSIYTYEPYYKTSGRATLPGDSKAWSSKQNPNDTYIYNGKDCCVQFEVWNRMLEELTNESDRETYKFDLDDAYVAQSIGRNGLPIDEDAKNRLLYVQTYKWNQLRVAVNIAAGRSINIGSPKQVAKFLYKDLGLPERRNRKGGVTTNEDALVSLLAVCKDKINTYRTDSKVKEWQFKLDVLRVIIDIRGLSKSISSYFAAKCHQPGLMKGIYNVAGTANGRWSASMYVDNTGINQQTLPRDDIYIPPELEGLSLEELKAKSNVENVIKEVLEMDLEEEEDEE